MQLVPTYIRMCKRKPYSPAWFSCRCKSYSVYCSLLARSPVLASEARCTRERASEWRSREGWRKGELATNSSKISFLPRPDEAKYLWMKMTHRQLILIDDVPGWPAISSCRTFENTMLTEIWNMIITLFSGEEKDRSLLLRSVNDFWGLRGCIFYRSVCISTPRNI